MTKLPFLKISSYLENLNLAHHRDAPLSRRLIGKRKSTNLGSGVMWHSRIAPLEKKDECHFALLRIAVPVHLGILARHRQIAISYLKRDEWELDFHRDML